MVDPQVLVITRWIAVASSRNVDVTALTVAWLIADHHRYSTKPLAKKIEDLIRSTGAVGDALLDVDPEIGAVTAAARTRISHPSTDKVLDAAGRHWYGQVLRWVVRTRLLAELLGDSNEAQRRVVGHEPFRRALREIGEVSRN